MCESTAKTTTNMPQEVFLSLLLYHSISLPTAHATTTVHHISRISSQVRRITLIVISLLLLLIRYCFTGHHLDEPLRPPLNLLHPIDSGILREGSDRYLRRVCGDYTMTQDNRCTVNCRAQSVRDRLHHTSDQDASGLGIASKILHNLIDRRAGGLIHRAGACERCQGRGAADLGGGCCAG